MRTTHQRPRKSIPSPTADTPLRAPSYYLSSELTPEFLSSYGGGRRDNCRSSQASLCSPVHGLGGLEALAPPPFRFDPYPYGLLTFIVSLEGVLIATFVVIKQNRMAVQSDQRDHLNLQVDLLAEQEMTAVLR
jgi:hypothetical protein